MQAWTEDHPAANIGLRLPPNVLGVDVDCYAGKPGAATLKALEAAHGTLPPTVASTSRSDGSAIGLFRVPPGRSWPTGPGPGIEFVHAGHRYVVAAPSMHPEGRPYRWVLPAGHAGNAVTPADLPDLPSAWV